MSFLMSKHKPQYLVSTDSIGFLGRPEQFVELWQEYFNDKTLDGVEVVAFKPLNRLNELIKTLKSNNIPVLSFHGKTGGEELFNLKSRLMMTLVNYFVVDIETLLKYYPQIEFLSHAPYLGKNSVKKIVVKDRPEKIWVENHLSGVNGVEDAIKEILFYRENKINALGMLDIYHYIAHEVETIRTNWPNIVEKLKSYILLKDKNGKQFYNGIHFPIGTRLNDSLPIDEMTDEMLELFAKNIIPYIERVVFENQQKDLGLFFSTNKMLREQKERNKRMVERLKKTGIIY